ncbi:hypothetical protein [Psychrobacillus antarcticus]|uniref:hypothetical protein n=1 Tax=Psychrobacillus antarcticus TaxID=2879115 RepID=UPI0024077CAE|nr:hypothetical protein [Psychrobacillus antarcticus]
MKKILSVLLATVIIGASVVTPFSTVEAESITKAESFVRTAEQHAGALKWQISYELTKEIKYPDMKIFNLTKDAYLKAKNEIAKASVKDKVKLEKRLEENVGKQYNRAIGYIDAITSGKKIVDKANHFSSLYAANPTSDLTERSYHDLSSEIRKQAILLYRVYGKSTRDAILTQYKTPGEKALQSSKNVITAKMHVDELDKMITKNTDQKTVETHVIEFFNLLDKIEDEAINSVLYDAYQVSIKRDSNFIAQEKEIIEFFKKSDEYASAEDLEGMFGLYSEEYPDYANLKTEIETTFKDFDVKYETLGLEIQYITDGIALVIQDEKSTIDEKEELEITFVYLLEKDDSGNWKYLDILDVQ